MSLFGRSDEKNVGDWGLRNGSLVDPLLCIEVSSNARSKTLTCLLFDLKKKTVERIAALPQDMLWINPINTPEDSPKIHVIELAKKIYSDFVSKNPIEPKVVKKSSVPSSVQPKLSKPISVPSTSSVPKTAIEIQIQTSSKVKKSKVQKTKNMGQTSSKKNQDQEDLPNEEFSTQTVFDQVEAGKAAALIVLQQAQSRVQAANSDSNTSNDSSSSSTGSIYSGPKTKTKVREGSGMASGSISSTLEVALSRSELEAQSKSMREREQESLLYDVRNIMNGRANKINGSVSSSTSSNTSSTSYHSTSGGIRLDEEEKELLVKDNTDLKTHLSGNSTTLSDSKSMVKPNTNDIRILNLNGKDSTSHCFLEADLVIDPNLKDKLNNEVSRFAGHTTRRPPSIGLGYAYVFDGVNIKLVCIEEHLDLLTKLVHALACQVGIVGNRGGDSVWEMVQKQLLDKNSSWIFKDIMSITVATTLINNSNVREWQKKWSNQVTSILQSMKTNFNVDENGK